jgi:hypothetical protein
MGSSRKKLTVKLTGMSDDRISAEAVISVIQGTIDALKELNRSVSEYGKANIEWQIVFLSMQSPLEAVFEGVDERSDLQNVEAPTTITSWMSGLSLLESASECPPRFNERSLGAIVRIRSSCANRVRRVEYREDNGEYLLLTDAMLFNANQAILRISRTPQPRNDYVDHGSIEGVLTTLSTRSGSDRIVIAEGLDSHKVSCFFRDEANEERARKAWKRRVIVTGAITYIGANGKPKRVDVDDIRVMPEECELPQVDELERMDITNGVESAEYVRSIRDGI